MNRDLHETISENLKNIGATVKIDPSEINWQINDPINHPSHYTNSDETNAKAECIDIIIDTQGPEDAQAFCICNAIKYLYRHKMKNGIEDIRKAKWYIDKYLELEDTYKLGGEMFD